MNKDKPWSTKAVDYYHKQLRLYLKQKMSFGEAIVKARKDAQIWYEKHRLKLQ